MRETGKTLFGYPVVVDESMKTPAVVFGTTVIDTHTGRIIPQPPPHGVRIPLLSDRQPNG